MRFSGLAMTVANTFTAGVRPEDRGERPVTDLRDPIAI
jgi:hypothetical protein